MGGELDVFGVILCSQTVNMILENFLINEVGLSSDLYGRLIETCDRVFLKRKDYLLHQGQICRFIGFVESGVLRSYIEKEGDDYISDFYFEGSFITSYRSFLTKEASVGSIQALEASNEWYKLGKYIADTLFIKKCRKETSLLMDNALDRYKLLLQTYPNIEQHVSQYHIASYLGIKPESLSRLKSLNIGQ